MNSFIDYKHWTNDPFIGWSLPGDADLENYSFKEVGSILRSLLMKWLCPKYEHATLVRPSDIFEWSNNSCASSGSDVL